MCRPQGQKPSGFPGAQIGSRSQRTEQGWLPTCGAGPRPPQGAPVRPGRARPPTSCPDGAREGFAGCAQAEGTSGWDAEDWLSLAVWLCCKHAFSPDADAHVDLQQLGVWGAATVARVSGVGVGGQDHRCPGSAGFAEQRVQLLGTRQGLVKALEERTDDVMAWTMSPKIRIQAHPVLLHSALLGFTDTVH